MRLTDGMTIPFEGIAFDMDGTLIDSTLLIEKLWRDWATIHRVQIEPILTAAHGRKAADVVRLFAPANLDPLNEARKLTENAAVALEGLQEVRGAAALLQSLPHDRWAIVTSAERALATKWLNHLRLPLPKIMITAEDVSEGKPNPSGYLQAASRLNCKPADMIVFEDALNGILAGERADAQVIALSTSLRPEELGDRRWIPNFENVCIERCVLTFV